MSKIYKVKAKVSTYYSAFVEVPDDWSPEDTIEWYAHNGTSGEFTEEEERAEWEFLEPVESDYDGEPDMIVNASGAL